MATFTMRHDLDCTEERFWDLFFDRDFTIEMFKYLEFPKFEIAETREEGDEKIRIVKASPKLDAPGPVKKLLGDNFGYTEEGRFNKNTKVFKFVVKPNTMEGKIKNEGTVRIEQRDGGKKCTRVVDVVVEAKVFGLGGTIEKMTEKSFRDGWGKSATWINDWVKKNP